MIGIIGGTGFYDPDFIREQQILNVETQYGSKELLLGEISNRRVCFISRHGIEHQIPPHKVDYRKNILALKTAGVKKIISINSVGSLKEGISPESVLIPHDFIDLTKGRESTFYDDEVVHVDMTEPYCASIRKTLFKSAEKIFKNVFRKGVYVCTQGPRFETPSEIKMLQKLGGDVVGMVGFPEVALAREAGICYASICLIANYGCGISKEPLNIEEVKATVSSNIKDIKKIVRLSIEGVSSRKECSCYQ